MKLMRLIKSLPLFLLLALSATRGQGAPVGTAFLYQGLLTVNGSPANGAYEMIFTLFQQGAPPPAPSVSNNNVAVSLGVFTVSLDFGAGVFNGTAYELGIAVRERGSGGPFVPLMPRQPLSPTPNSVHAQTASSVPDSALSANVPLLNGSPMFSTAVSVTMLRVADSSGASLLKFGPTDDCTVGVDPQGPPGLLLRDPRGVRIVAANSSSTPRLLFGPTDDCSVGIDPTGMQGLLLRDPKGVRILPPSNALPRLLFGPTDDCSIGIDPAFPGLIERDPIGFRLLGPNNQGCRLIFGPTMNCTVEVNPAGPAGLLLRDTSGIRILPPSNALPRLLFGPTDDCSVGIDPVITGLILRDPRGVRIASTAPGAVPRLLFGPTDDCSIGIDPTGQLPGLIERDPIGFRLLGPNNQGCRLIFGPTMNCTVEVNPAGPAGLLLRDPSGIRILSPVATAPPVLRFGPTDDCSIGIDPVLTGLRLRDPGVRIAPTAAAAVPRLLFGPTENCTIGIDPAGPPGLLLRDPSGIRIVAAAAGAAPPRLLFGPTDDCSIGIDPALPGLIERDPIGFRLLGPNNQGCRLIFGPTMNCTVEVNPAGPAGLLLRDPSGIRILPPSNALPRMLFGPTDDCSIGIDPAFPGLVERDPIGLRLLGQNNQGGRLIFGPTMNCAIEVQPPGNSNSIAGLILRDPRGVRIWSPISGPTGGTNVLLFGPTDDCRITAGDNSSQAGMRFSDPRGFAFSSQMTVNGPVFAQAFIQTSSRRFKNDVKPIENPLEKISKLQGVRFTWNEEKGGAKDIGFIAEEVAKVIPEVVSWEEDGQNARGVNYDHLVAVAIEGIKAQQSQIKTLEREKSELRESLDAMQSKLDRLSQQVQTLMAR